jgi:peptidoglycan/LPS O-acetylase OafA/YrhL
VTLDGALHGPPWAPRVILAALCEIIPGLPTARLSGQDFSFIPYAWTLRVEFAFYLAAFATCAAMGRSRQRPAVLGGAIALAYATFLIFVLRHGAGLRQILCVPFFAFGLACFLTEKRSGVLPRLNLLAMALCVPLAFTYWGQRGHPILAWQLACLGPLLLGFYGLTRIGDLAARLRLLDSRLGELSYPLYIGHGVILVSLASLTERRSWPLYTFGMVASVLLAAALHQFGEKPFQGLRDRLRGQPVAMAGNCNSAKTK